MPNLNRITIIGNCGKEAEMRYTPSGVPFASFSVAVNNKFKNNQGELQEETEWFNCVVWSKLAETVNQFLKKGQQVYVEGRQKTRTWEGQDGQKHWRTELIAQRVLFLGKRDVGTDVTKEVAGAEIAEGTDDIDPSDIPF